MNERRISRLQEQIKQRLAEVLLRDIADPKLGLVTITRVVLDSEFTHCKAYWSVMAAGAAAEQRARAQSEGVLRRARGLCQSEIAKAVNTRTTPHLEFVFDESIAGAINASMLAIAASVFHVQGLESVGDGPAAVRPAASFLVVTLRVESRAEFFDFGWSHHYAVLVDAAGRDHVVARPAQKALDKAGRNGCAAEIPPGGECSAAVVFDVDPAAGPFAVRILFCGGPIGELDRVLLGDHYLSVE